MKTHKTERLSGKTDTIVRSTTHAHSFRPAYACEPGPGYTQVYTSMHATSDFTLLKFKAVRCAFTAFRVIR